jgi:hypothetical protein
MDMWLAGPLGLLFIASAVVLAVLWFTLPFAVFRIRRESINATKLLGEIREQLALNALREKRDAATTKHADDADRAKQPNDADRAKQPDDAEEAKRWKPPM